MKSYKYRISTQCFQNIYSFYRNVARKYKHTYSKELLHKNIDDAIDSMFQIERSLHRRQPTIPEWIGLHMANTDKWYYAYYFENEETIMIVDARHAQNMKGVLDL